MPTFTAIAWDSLLETGSRNPNPKPPQSPVRSHPHPPPASNFEKKRIPSRTPHAVSPILYATPDATPLPDAPSSFHPSPYIIDHKHRGPRLLKSFSQDSVVVDESQRANLDLNVGAVNAALGVVGDSKGGDLEVVVNGAAHGNLENGVIGKEKSGKSVAVKVESDAELDDFLDFQESMSTASNSDMDEHSWKPSTPSSAMCEYYDAFEEISSDGGSRSSLRNDEDELREIRLKLLMEIEKRKQAEGSLGNLRSQWQSLSQHLLLVGLTLPALPAVTDETSEQPNSDPPEDLCRQVVIARVVAGSIGRACSRAEVEMEMEPLIESKNFDISRLLDRLHYYEALNREMSQRNQEAVETARQKRHKRKRRQRWIWSSVGLAVSLGVAAIAWSYVPASKHSPHEGETPNSHID